MKTAKIILDNIKESDAWFMLCEELGIDEEKRRAHFEFSEYANLELEFDENLNVVSGRVIPLAEASK